MSPQYPACCVSNTDLTFRCVQLALAGWAIFLPGKREMEESNLPELADDLATLKLGSQSRGRMLYARDPPVPAAMTPAAPGHAPRTRGALSYPSRAGTGLAGPRAPSSSGAPRGWRPPPLQAAAEGPSGLRAVSAPSNGRQAAGEAGRDARSPTLRPAVEGHSPPIRRRLRPLPRLPNRIRAWAWRWAMVANQSHG